MIGVARHRNCPPQMESKSHVEGNGDERNLLPIFEGDA